ncbi:MAG: M23 family metallopeptidase [Candidatus Cloacimonetes bacterium]|nr:M23 family metallopeptidase [Candidatus Cloacimonadota bacterium]
MSVKIIVVACVVLMLLITAFFFRENLRLRNAQETALNKPETIHQDLSSNESIFSDSLAIIELLKRYSSLAGNSLLQMNTDMTIGQIKKEAELYQLKKRLLPDTCPVPPETPVSQVFSSQHEGIDFPLPLRSPIVSAAAGVIDSIGTDRFFGRWVLIRHLNGYTTFYAHLDSVLHQRGQFVKKGEQIALSGNTGNSTDPHLHFEIRFLRERLNPAGMMQLKVH